MISSEAMLDCVLAGLFSPSFCHAPPDAPAVQVIWNAKLEIGRRNFLYPVLLQKLAPLIICKAYRH